MASLMDHIHKLYKVGMHSHFFFSTLVKIALQKSASRSWNYKYTVKAEWDCLLVWDKLFTLAPDVTEGVLKCPRHDSSTGPAPLIQCSLMNICIGHKSAHTSSGWTLAACLDWTTHWLLLQSHAQCRYSFIKEQCTCTAGPALCMLA